MSDQEATQAIGMLTNRTCQRFELFWACDQLRRLLHLVKRVEDFLYLLGVIALRVGQPRVTRHGNAPSVIHILGSIIGVSDFGVISILPLTSVSQTVHIPTGKLGTRPPGKLMRTRRSSGVAGRWACSMAWSVRIAARSARALAFAPLVV